MPGEGGLVLTSRGNVPDEQLVTLLTEREQLLPEHEDLHERRRIDRSLIDVDLSKE